MSKRTKDLGISAKVRKEVYERDRWCVLCGNPHNLQCAHFISRGSGGLGIPQNLVMLCVNCHIKYDQTSARDEIRKEIKNYLSRYYEINEKELKYASKRNY